MSIGEDPLYAVSNKRIKYLKSALYPYAIISLTKSTKLNCDNKQPVRTCKRKQILGFTKAIIQQCFPD